MSPPNVIFSKINATRAEGLMFKELLNASAEELEALRQILCGQLAKRKLTNQRLLPREEYDLQRKLRWVKSELALRPHLQ